MSGELIFVDTETTGLDHHRHAVWEVALVDVDGRVLLDCKCRLTAEQLAKADGDALRVGSYYRRSVVGTVYERETVAQRVAVLTEGRVLAGFNPSFDQAMLAELLREAGLEPAWDYHVLAVEAYVAGALGLLGLAGGAVMSAKAVGVDPDSEGTRHTALADARLAARVFRVASAIGSAKAELEGAA